MYTEITFIATQKQIVKWGDKWKRRKESEKSDRGKSSLGLFTAYLSERLVVFHWINSFSMSWYVFISLFAASLQTP